MMNSGLSEEGHHRRDEILTLVLEESRRVHRRRKRRRRLSAAAVSVIMLAALAWVSWPPTEPSVPKRPQAGHDPIRPSGVQFDLERYIARNKTDELDRYLVPTREQVSADTLVDDAELLGALAELGRVEGIIRADGKTWLASELESQLEMWE